MKVCSKCGIEKDEGEFSFRDDTGKLRGACKICIKKHKQEYNEKNKIHIAKYKSERYRKNYIPAILQWTEEKIRKEALKYNTKKAFRNNGKGAVAAAKRLNIWDEVCSHMTSRLTFWTDDEIFEDALKYKSRWEYQQNSNSYYAAKHKGHSFLNEVCEHMSKPTDIASGFRVDKPAIMYYLKINDGEVYKIGITNRTVTARFNVYDLKKIEVLKVWEFKTGKDALEQEQRIKKDFAHAKYIGEPILNDGNTELFTHDILLLDC